MKYYDYNRVLSYNAFLNFLIGERGVGKSYGAVKHVIKTFLKTGQKFVYIRRFKTELKKSVPTFFDKVRNDPEFTKVKFNVSKNNFFINNELAGYSFSLTTAQQNKSANYDNVKYIIFDEFIIEKNSLHYLADEVAVFLGAVETIARDRDVNVFLLGNAVSTTNPYFAYFDLNLPYNNDIVTYKQGLILLQYMNNEEFREEKSKTRFGQLVSGTPFYDYSISNKFVNENKNFIEKKSGSAKYAFSILYKDNIFGVWNDFLNNKSFISFDTQKDGFIYSCTLDDMKPNAIFLKMVKKSFAWSVLLTAFQTGNLRYENQKIKNLTEEIIKIILRS